MMRNNSGFNTPSPPPSIMRDKDARFDQILDENDHQRVADGNREALFQERLESLRALKYELSQDDWKYQNTINQSNATRY
mmetsp:Transcript_4500/g.5209  ORF Transcript_4500/g.5209 Transcript_4500/m.5209 type:complete len:80 (+) Transcript_4500:49-288(+)